MTDSDGGDAIALAERILVLLDEGARTATYKLAVLAALMDLCLEHTTRDGLAPDTLYTRPLAEKVIDLYWPQTAAYSGAGGRRVLRQNTRGQAEIVTAIERFRTQLSADPGCSLSRARAASPTAWETLARTVEWKLIEMPLPRLQRVGGVRDEILYSIGWDEHVTQREVRDYQRHLPSAFDNRIVLRPGVGGALVRLHGLLRPMLQRQWARMVAQLNELEEAKLESFLFGADRISLQPVSGPLLELQDGCCFYCEERIHGSGRGGLAIDHFVPWSRHPDNAIENLVPAHARCNGDKSDLLAARTHVERWRARMATRGSDLATIAHDAGFEQAPGRALNVARGIYLLLPPRGRLWLHNRELELVGSEPLAPLFAPLATA